ncbi:Ubiquitin--protein ligase [Handroanthus impetiginosus]|uniref:RBR-type E3 ubiquitin transferase n=1 Tax=Handroanthus impetiginosus TaxID=429701 RepID=A0A2G9HAV4_9LAMI|nr:Ubiquitin--protein ligase [Handroanthus impetiginosus]
MRNQPITALSGENSNSPLCLLNHRRQEFQDHNTIISDAKYAEELLFQEALMVSLNWDSGKRPEEVIESSSQKGSSELGEPSQFFCEICAETRDSDQVFSVQTCDHKFCTECIAKHISVKIQKSPISDQVHGRFFACPGLDCKGVLEIEKCMQIVPKDVLSMWGDTICESMIGVSQNFYCPYKDCSGLLVNDGDEKVRESECPFCHRLFCAECKVPWHSGVGCEEFSRMSESERGREDLMVHELAKLKKWQRCPHCKFFVEKNHGCLHMTCRCGYQFCYACGATWSSIHPNSCRGSYCS